MRLLNNDRFGRLSWMHLVVLLMLLSVIGMVSYSQVEAEGPDATADVVMNVERLSLGTGSVQGNASSYFGYLSEDARYTTFESWASNWTPDSVPNWVDIFVRDRVANTTIKITDTNHDGHANEDSFDPIMTADGRYIVYTSYASNLVPNDHNGDSPLIRDGLDVFLYDRITGSTDRVSLNSGGNEIMGNSVGSITPDSNYILFASNGVNVIAGDSNGDAKTALYLRDWRTGSIERITGTDGQFPNNGVGGARASYDGRYIVYKSESSNLVPNDTNGLTDIFLYDRETEQTIRVSEPPGGGNSDGKSGSVDISSDGQTIVFRSKAANLTSGDTNAQWDIFIYTIDTGNVRRVNLSSSGQQTNGDSKDPSICGNGRFVSFSSDANNLVPGDTNLMRDVFLVDLERDEISVVTMNDDDEWQNGRAHRSYLAQDCRSITFATEATNMVANDTNESRDLFISDIIWPADLSHSTQSGGGIAEPGDTITYTFTLKNVGIETAVANFVNILPDNATFLPDSLTGGAVYHLDTHTIDWSGPLAEGGEISFSFAVVTDPGITEFTLIRNQATLTGDGDTYDLSTITVLNGLRGYMPIAVLD